MGILITGLLIVGTAVGVFCFTRNSPKHSKAIADKAKELAKKTQDAAKVEFDKLKAKK